MKIGNKVLKTERRLPAGRQGFTLIELLVVIAIIGVMMGAVIVAINPAKRLADARDSDGKTRVNAVATAMEACYAVNVGTYVPCDTIATELVPDYIKVAPVDVIMYPIPCTAAKCCLYYNLENGGYWAYESACGKAQERAAVAVCPDACP